MSKMSDIPEHQIDHPNWEDGVTAQSRATAACEARELKPCPFCGNSNLKACVEHDEGGTPQPAVYCQCGACGPICDSIEQAVPAWNARRHNWVKCSERGPDADGLYNIVLVAINYYGFRRKPEIVVGEWLGGFWKLTDNLASRYEDFDITHWRDDVLKLPEDV